MLVHAEEKATELYNRFSVLEDKYPIAEQKIYHNQQPYEGPTRLSNKRKPQVVIN